MALGPRTLFVTGKGGVGKTTMAAALALAYRDAGVRTLLVELDGQASATSLLSARAVRYEPTPLSPGLWALCIDAENALKEYARLRLKVRAVADRVVGNPVFQQFAQAAPGFRELLLLGKLWALSQQLGPRRKPQFEAIIVDAPATGHGLGLLGMAGVVARMFPVGPIAVEARQVDAFIRDPERTGVVLVSLPEEMPVTESIELRDRLADQGVAVARVVLNGVLPSRFSDDEIERIEELRDNLEQGGRVGAALDTAVFEHERCADQQAERARLEHAFGDMPVLPHLHVTRLGRDDVESLARWLTAKGQRTLSRSLMPKVVRP